MRILGYELEVIKNGYRIKNLPINIVKVPGTKNWYSKVWIANERRYKVRTSGSDDLGQAVLNAIALNAEVSLLIKHDISLFSHKFKDVVSKWFQELTRRQQAKQVSEHMMRIYRNATRVHLLPYFGDHLITGITSASLDRYIQDRMRSNPAENSLIFEKTTMGLILKFAKEQGWYKADPIPIIQIPRGARTTERRGVFTEEEVERLITQIDNYIEQGGSKRGFYLRNVLDLAIRFMLETGCRTNDLRYLTWRDITFNVDKQHYVATLRGKPSKNKRSRRITFKNDIYVELEGWKLSSMNLYSQETDLVFANKSGRFEPLDREFSSLMAFAGIPKSFEGEERTLYSLRHTFISRKLVAGVSAFDIAKQCGTSVKQIEKHYGHYLDEQLFNKIFGNDV